MLDTFREVVVADFEFAASPGERPDPICLVAHELRSGRRFRLMRDQIRPGAALRDGARRLFVAYYASAELAAIACSAGRCRRASSIYSPNSATAPTGCRRRPAPACSGRWPIRPRHHGRHREEGDAEAHLRGGPWTRPCTPDRDPRLLRERRRRARAAAAGHAAAIDLPRALLRGRYMAAASAMEHDGMPIDVETLALLREHWDDIQDELIARHRRDYGVYDGRTFKPDRLAAWLARQQHPLAAARERAARPERRHLPPAGARLSCVSPLRELRSALSDLRLNDLAVGRDGRNRTILSAFRSRTGRNQPTNTKFISGRACGCAG